jgi:hypothetical protein
MSTTYRNCSNRDTRCGRYSVVGNYRALPGSTTEGARVSLLGNPATGSGNPYTRLNAAMVAPPRLNSIGLESGVNYLTGPGIANWDLSLQKTFSIKERVHMELRADAFNVFNQTQFTGVNSTITYASLTNLTPTNLYLNANGTVNNINGFGTVSGARDPRIMQLVVRLKF